MHHLVNKKICFSWKQNDVRATLISIIQLHDSRLSIMACIEDLPTEVLAKIHKFVDLSEQFRAACFFSKNLRCALGEILNDNNTHRFVFRPDGLFFRDSFRHRMEGFGYVINYHVSLREFPADKNNFEEIFHKWRVEVTERGHQGTPAQKKFRSVENLWYSEAVEKCVEDILNEETRANQSVYTVPGKGKGAGRGVVQTSANAAGKKGGGKAQRLGVSADHKGFGSAAGGGDTYGYKGKGKDALFLNSESELFASDSDTDQCSCEFSDGDPSDSEKVAGGIESWSGKRWMNSIGVSPDVGGHKRSRYLIQFPRSAKHRALLAGAEVGYDELWGVGDLCDHETEIFDKCENLHVKWARLLGEIRATIGDFLRQSRGKTVLAIFARNDVEDCFPGVDHIPRRGHATGKAARFLYVECDRKSFLLTVKLAVQKQEYGYPCGSPKLEFRDTELKAAYDEFSWI